MRLSVDDDSDMQLIEIGCVCVCFFYTSFILSIDLSSMDARIIAG